MTTVNSQFEFVVALFRKSCGNRGNVSSHLFAVILSEAKDLLFPSQRSLLADTNTLPDRPMSHSGLRSGQSSFRAKPAFNMLFAGYCYAHVLMRFKVYEAVNSVLPGKFRTSPLAVLPYAARQIVGHAGVKRSRTACQDVNKVLLLQFRLPVKRVLRTTKSRSFASLRMTGF